MNKAQLVVLVARDLKTSKAAAGRAVESVLRHIHRNVKQGVCLSGFGTFSTVKRGARNIHNPRDGSLIRIKATTAVKFKPGKALKKSL